MESHACYAIAYRILRDVGRSQDAVQQALLAVWRDLPQLRDPNRFQPWLYRLLVRCCYEEARRGRGWDQHVQQVQIDPGDDSRDFTAQVADRDVIDRAFRGLSAEHRAVMVLHHYADMTLAQVADIAGIPVGTVKSRLNHASRAMRLAIEADDLVGFSKERPA